MRIFSLVVFAAFTATVINAQSKETEKYRKESEEMRKQIWAWDKPQFRVKDIPREYATASKVVIAHHTELTADSKSKIAFYGLGFGAKKEQSITEIVREIIKVNDKNAVTDYSEFSFTQFAKTSGFFASDKMTTYVGVKVIKPNGTSKEINADDIVLTKDASSEKKAKVAIPDLQPGDILDYFIATEQTLTNDLSEKAYRVFLFDDAPILSLSFHAQLGKKFAIEYRSYNGAPELKVSKNDDKEIIVDVEKTNIPPFETSLWVAPVRQLPFIRMNISLGYSGFGSRYLDTRKPGEVTKSLNSDEALDDKADQFSTRYYNGYWMKAAKAQYDDIESSAKRKAKQMGLNFSSLSDDEKAALLFYTFRFNYLLNFNIDALSETINSGQKEYDGLSFALFCTMKAAGIDPAILISEVRTGFRINEAMDANDLVSTAYLTGSKKFLSIQSIYDIPFQMPSYIEGVKNTKSFTFDHPAAIMSMKKMSGLTNITTGPNVPASASDKNVRREDLHLSLTDDRSALTVKRTTTLKGIYKEDEQKNLILYEDYYESERKSFNEEKSLIEELEDGKRSKSKKYVEEVKNAFTEARKKQKDAFLKEAKDWFEQDITDMKDQKVKNLGVRHTSPDFIYSSAFTMGGLVKKAGNNIIIDIGKMQGQPLSVKDEQRKRDIDIYMAFARSIEYLIELEIPEGYTAEGLAALNVKVENETGVFATEATSTDKLVTIKVKKHYLHSFEPAANFDKMLAFIDASNNWVNAKLLLKKK
ncbi:MAG: DUF3857 domain-containing protein [Chitinophagaceae bacterium]|nr:DUF3857 domain-containing protein [Chitinophagaceae bacterium]